MKLNLSIHSENDYYLLMLLLIMLFVVVVMEKAVSDYILLSSLDLSVAIRRYQLTGQWVGKCLTCHLSLWQKLLLSIRLKCLGFRYGWVWGRIDIVTVCHGQWTTADGRLYLHKTNELIDFICFAEHTICRQQIYLASFALCEVSERWKWPKWSD